MACRHTHYIGGHYTKISELGHIKRIREYTTNAKQQTTQERALDINKGAGRMPVHVQCPCILCLPCNLGGSLEMALIVYQKYHSPSRLSSRTPMAKLWRVNSRRSGLNPLKWISVIGEACLKMFAGQLSKRALLPRDETNQNSYVFPHQKQLNSC